MRLVSYEGRGSRKPDCITASPNVAISRPPFLLRFIVCFGGLFVQAGPGKIGTELLMEPQHGCVWVEREQAKGAGGSHGGDGSFWMSDEVWGGVALGTRESGALFGVVPNVHFAACFAIRALALAICCRFV